MPLHTVNSPQLNIQDPSLVAENNKVEQKVQTARDKLLRAQQETAMAKKCLEAEEARRKALVLWKQVE